MTYLYCAICGKRFEPDDNHIWLNSEFKRIDDQNKTEEYALHPSCWDNLTAGWNKPV